MTGFFVVASAPLLASSLALIAGGIVALVRQNRRRRARRARRADAVYLSVIMIGVGLAACLMLIAAIVA